MVKFLDLKGKLLIASSALVDDNFHQAVVFIIEHDARGSYGLVINHELHNDPLSRENLRIFRGGPVESEMVFVLHTNPAHTSDSALIDGVYFEKEAEIIQHVIVGQAPFRFYRGYAGWSTGQLEYEIHSNSWIVLNATKDIIFHEYGVELWRRCLVEKGGLFRYFALTHKDVSLN